MKYCFTINFTAENEQGDKYYMTAIVPAEDESEAQRQLRGIPPLQSKTIHITSVEFTGEVMVGERKFWVN